MELPLSGTLVLDLTQIYNGPYATFMMAAAGAEVIKIEPPGGEHMRRRTVNRGPRLPYAMLNAGKRSLCLDLKKPAACDILLRLVEGADVLVENFAPGVMDKLGLGATSLRARGALRWVEHPEYGRIAAAASPLRFEGKAMLPEPPSVPLGADSRAILQEKLGLSDTEIHSLQEAGVI